MGPKRTYDIKILRKNYKHDKEDQKYFNFVSAYFPTISSFLDRTHDKKNNEAQLKLQFYMKTALALYMLKKNFRFANCDCGMRRVWSKTLVDEHGERGQKIHIFL